jgi:hypothetical protein
MSVNHPSAAALMEDPELFGEEVRRAVQSADPASLARIATRMTVLTLEAGTFPKECFEILLELLKKQAFIELTGSWNLLRVFVENWSSLSEEQRDDLLPALEARYEQFKDWIAPFVISGMLGACYRDDRALEALGRLKKCKSEIPRSFVVHGFEHLVTDSLDKRVADRALEHLKELGQDESDVVRAEVNESLSKINKRLHADRRVPAEI